MDPVTHVIRPEPQSGLAAPPVPVRSAKDPVTIVIFGASGDLTKRKLVPALHQLGRSGYLPERYAIIGFSRTEMTDAAFASSMVEALEKTPEAQTEQTSALARILRYQSGSNGDPASFSRLKAKIEAVEKELGLPGNRLFYLSVAPEFFAPIIRHLSQAGLIHDAKAPVWSRVIIEKPFGRDLDSARALTSEIGSCLDESQIYRIDHYLGKETVQNILSFRFGNAIFEPLFSEKYVDNVQITVAETLGMEGRRGTYFESAGVLRDMVQNHMLQLLSLIAMEPPSSLDAQAIRDEKVKVLRAIDPLTRAQVAAQTVRGQYGTGEREGQIVKGYRQEEGVAPQSITESYVALRLRIDNWRWAGVPFLLRSGKRLRKRVSEVAVTFKHPPLHLFRQLQVDAAVQPPPHSNLLLFRIQPDEGISLSFVSKQPGMEIQLDEVRMDFFYNRAFQQRSPEAYERLLLDALKGDASLFTRSDEVECAWRLVTSIHKGWAELPPPSFPNYFPFTDGPDEAQRLLEGTSAKWRSLADA
jgi:glucose-6-phosphate 1-dehydrogenase